jgi:hypothetical protein
LTVLQRVRRPYALRLLSVRLGNRPRKSDDLELGVREDEVAAREELEEQSVLAIAELELEDAIGADLGDAGQAPRLEELAEAGAESRGGGSRRAGEVGQVAAEARVDKELLLDIGLRELEQQDAGGEVVDVSESEGDQALVELVCDDLDAVRGPNCAAAGLGMCGSP